MAPPLSAVVPSTINEEEVVTLCNEQYGEYRLSAINDCRESIKNHKYLLKFEAKLEKPLDAK
jgi:hypothetical protein